MLKQPAQFRRFASPRIDLFIQTIHPHTPSAGWSMSFLTTRSVSPASSYDAMIVAAALQSESDTLWSEDMHHGLVRADRLRNVNSFRDRI
jgi:hypothetical protein